MHVVVGGASGFLGSALVAHLRQVGHRVTRLVRHEARKGDESSWDPASGRIDQVVIDRADAVVSLSGASIARWPRTKSYRNTLRQSRLDPTSTLAKAVAHAERPPVLLSGSAMGYYGQDRGTASLDEHASTGDGFLAELVRDWEAAAAPAQEAGARVAFLRTSLVLHRDGGLLAPLLPLFKAGGGARLGSGRQHMSLMSRVDWVRAVAHLLENDVAGPVNLVGPDPVTNAMFTDALGDVLNRPTFLVAPSPVLKIALGSLSGDLLGSVQMTPGVLESTGFTFDHPTLRQQLESALHDA